MSVELLGSGLPEAAWLAAEVVRKECHAADRQRSGIPFQTREISFGLLTSNVANVGSATRPASGVDSAGDLDMAMDCHFLARFISSCKRFWSVVIGREGICCAVVPNMGCNILLARLCRLLSVDRKVLILEKTEFVDGDFDFILSEA